MAATSKTNQDTTPNKAEPVAKPQTRDRTFTLPLKVVQALAVAAAITELDESAIVTKLIMHGLPNLAGLQPYLGVVGTSEGDVHSIAFDLWP
jgi:hypothetical protein